MAKYNLGSAGAGALSGATAGSAFGPIGTGIGALGGGLLGLFGSKKKKQKTPKKVSVFDDKQQKLYKDFQQSLYGKGPFSDQFNYNADAANQNFDKNVSAPAYREFKENIIPSVTGQFRTNNLQNSSYHGEALARKGRDIQETLNALRSDMHFKGQEGANANRQNAISGILGTSTFDYMRPQNDRPSSIDNILKSAAPSVGKFLDNYLSRMSDTRGGIGGLTSGGNPPTVGIGGSPSPWGGLTRGGNPPIGAY